jgi:hypothetical protein
MAEPAIRKSTGAFRERQVHKAVENIEQGCEEVREVPPEQQYNRGEREDAEAESDRAKHVPFVEAHLSKPSRVPYSLAELVTTEELVLVRR